MLEPEPLQWLLRASPRLRTSWLRRLSKTEQAEWRWHWHLWARAAQLPPDGDWRVWLVMAGRGFGKTRAGAEWVRLVAEDPAARIALVAATLNEGRAVMVEGESGLLSVCPPHRAPKYEPSLRRLSWDNGATATLYSAGEPEALRGPQHSHAWCDELGKWEDTNGQARRTWENLMLGLRVGDAPRIMVTTTPRTVPLVRKLLGQTLDGQVIVTRGSTLENRAHLPRRFIEDVTREFAGTTLGRQELDGEMIEDLPGALWTRALLEACREAAAPPMTRVVVAVDPPASAHGDACGIVVCGLGDDRIARVLADASVEKASPERWARAVAEAARVWSADRVASIQLAGTTPAPPSRIIWPNRP